MRGPGAAHGGNSGHTQLPLLMGTQRKSFRAARWVLSTGKQQQGGKPDGFLHPSAALTGATELPAAPSASLGVPQGCARTWALGMGLEGTSGVTKGHPPPSPRVIGFLLIWRFIIIIIVIIIKHLSSPKSSRSCGEVPGNSSINFSHKK